MTARGRHCLVTVTSDAFAIGTLVTIHSFLRTNPWFAGDIALIADTLSDDNRRLLTAALPGARWVACDAELDARLDRLVAVRPALAGRRARLLSLAALGIGGYDRLLFCDSDMVFTGDFAPLFAMDVALVACADSAMLRGGGRDRVSFAPATAGAPAATTFNAGMLLVGPALLDGAAYRQLVDLVTPESWDGVVTDHTDQLLLNRAFGDRVTLVSPRFNLMLGHRALGFSQAGVRIDDAALLHFNGPAKPWHTPAMTQASLRDAALLPAWRRWQDALAAALTDVHLAAARSSRS